MEVHHKSHSPKNFKEYILEGLMIFFAVTMGFFAESLREHIIESEREEAFMHSMWEDLKVDTARINYSITRLQSNTTAGDSLIYYYQMGKFDKSNSKKFAKFALGAGFSVDVVFNDRTSSQLKGTGSFRLIKKKDIADSLMVYWNNQIKLDQIHNRYEETRQKQKDVGFRTFVWYPSYFGSVGAKLADNDPDIDYIINRDNLAHFMNVTSSIYNTGISQYLKELKNQKQLAIHLIQNIHSSYHIE